MTDKQIEILKLQSRMWELRQISEQLQGEYNGLFNQWRVLAESAEPAKTTEPTESVSAKPEVFDGSVAKED